MLNAAIQDVNVVRDTWDWIAIGLAALGSFAAAWAIWYSAQSKRELVDERRRLFELEILREIATGIDNGFLFEISEHPERLRIFARRLDLLPGADLPLWRTLMDMQWPGDVSNYMGVAERQQKLSQELLELSKRQPDAEAPDAEQREWDERYKALTTDIRESAHRHREGVSRMLLDELVHAITVRVEAGSFERSRRWFGLWRRRPVGHVDQGGR